MSSKRGWDGTHDGPDACGCATPKPEMFYGRLVCAGCDGDIPLCEDCDEAKAPGYCSCDPGNDRNTDPRVDAACYRDERGER
jgi:hypothetical protein